ncbi:MAG: PAS domain S-box protein [Anaerolineae bacterium]|nr:PAS domain S-box protein [Anaerolineae bacterium]
MRYWFAPPKRQDEYETFAALVLHYTLLLLMGVVGLFAFFASSPTQLIYIPVTLAVFGGCYALLHSGRLNLASLIFLSGLWLVITLASFNLNGVRNASISSYAIVIIFSAVLFSGPAAAIFTGLSILATTILALGETAGVLPLHTTPLYLPDRFFQQIALFGAAGVLLSAASRVIRLSYQRIQRHEQTLLERNHALETEIAERRAAEASLRVSEERYRLLFQNIPVMAGVYGEDGEIILLNKAAAHVLGGTPESLRGRNLRDVLSPGDAEGAIAGQIRVIQDNEDSLVQGQTVLPNGREIHYLRHAMRMPTPSGSSPSQVLVLTTDMTEKYQAEQRERELKQAQEKNAFLTDFFNTVSHDLKTPLSVINTSLYLLKRAQPDQREERMRDITDQVTLMDRYIQDMLTISRLEHLPTFNFRKVDINPVVEEVVDMLRPRIEGKGLSFQFERQPNLPEIQGDQDQLHRMTLNLIENAVNYTPSGGQVMVKTRTDNGHVALEIRDTGIGIEPDALPFIFDRFFRSPKAKESERRGTGLGLAIVKKIVETHTGTIAVDSQPGAGTSFSVQFPALP